MPVTSRIYNISGESAGTIQLPDRVFAVKKNPALVWQVAESERANKRKNTAHTKMRGEVRGGGKKPWRQKGTGRARHGSIRSPIWVGGGVTHGPRNTRVYEKKVNKKMKIKALYAVLSQKVRENEILFLEHISVESAKTKDAAKIIGVLSKAGGFEMLGERGSVLLSLSKQDAPTTRAFRNIPNMNIKETRNMNVSDVLSHRYIIFPKESIPILESRSHS